MTPRSSRFQMVWILLYSGPNLSSGLFMSGYRPFLDDQPAAGHAGGEHGAPPLGGEDCCDVTRAPPAAGPATDKPHNAPRIFSIPTPAAPNRPVTTLAGPD